MCVGSVDLDLVKRVGCSHARRPIDSPRRCSPHNDVGCLLPRLEGQDASCAQLSRRHSHVGGREVHAASA